MLEKPIPLNSEAVHRLFYSYDIPQPTPEARLWRYMDFTKFVSMLDHGGLFFPRSTLLGDPFEGSFSRNNVELRPVLGDAYPVIAGAAEAMRSWVLVSCWHANDFESAAMWKLYSSHNESVAIQSTFSRLRAAVHGTKAVLGKVRYVDYSSQWIPEGHILYPYFHKRKSFEHENEVRAVMVDDLSDADPDALGSEYRNAGVWARVDLDQLVERIYVSPTSPDWFRELVERIAGKYGLERTVFRSSLTEAPVY